MAVVIRLRRTGRKNLPCFRINVTDSRFPRDGRLIETVGVYDPLRKDPAAQLVVKPERIAHWLSVGAKPSDIVASILRKKGVPMPPRKKRAERKHRGRKTRTGERRETVKTARAEAKVVRAAARKKAKRAAAKAAEPVAAQA